MTPPQQVQEILSLYKIEFLNEELGGGLGRDVRFGGGGQMEYFFFWFSGPDDIEDEVIRVVDHYLAGNPSPIDDDLTVGGGDYVEVTLSGVKFINRETHREEQLVPLDHFRVIASARAEFNRSARTQT